MPVQDARLRFGRRLGRIHGDRHGDQKNGWHGHKEYRASATGNHSGPRNFRRYHAGRELQIERDQSSFGAGHPGWTPYDNFNGSSYSCLYYLVLPEPTLRTPWDNLRPSLYGYCWL